MRHLRSVVGWAFVVAGVLILTLFSRPVQAEVYIAGQGGVSFPNSFSNIEVVGFSGLTISDLSLHKSVMYGGKLGYYFDKLKWLGVETEVFNSTPHIKQQPATASFGGFTTPPVTLIGQDLRVLNWAPINVVVRYQMGPLEPYAGVGLGLFFARVHDAASGESSSSNWRPGLNTQVGIRYMLTKQLSLFGEWKYNRASFNFDASSPTQATGAFKGDYSAHIAIGGVGWHF